MGIVNLMGRNAWTPADALRRTEAMIASEFPPDLLAVLQRKVTGAAIGQYVLSEAEQAELLRYQQVSYTAGVAHAQALADMAKLNAVLAYEAAQARLARALPPEDAPPALVAQDADEREAAQQVVADATPDTLALAEQRRPPPFVEQPTAGVLP